MNPVRFFPGPAIMGAIFMDEDSHHLGADKAPESGRGLEKVADRLRLFLGKYPGPDERELSVGLAKFVRI